MRYYIALVQEREKGTYRGQVFIRGKLNGRYHAFSPHNRSRVCSLYDSYAKAKRYAGPDGKVASFEIEEITDETDDKQKQYEDAERLIQLHADRANRLLKELKDGW